jgi:hypothetical protein
LQELNVGNWASKRVVKISDEGTITFEKNNGTFLNSWDIKEIAGVAYVAPTMLLEGALAICTNYQDSQVTTITTIALMPGALTITKADADAVDSILKWFEENKTSAATATPYDIEATSKGSFLALDGTTVIIRHTGFINQMAKGGMQGEKRIPIKSILSVQFKQASDITAGYIQFETAGGSQAAARGGVFEGAGDENTVLFSKAETPQFEAFRNRVDELINASPVASGGTSQADELAKFAKLRDEGILTEEEFAQKKKQILGL